MNSSMFRFSTVLTLVALATLTAPENLLARKPFRFLQTRNARRNVNQSFVSLNYTATPATPDITMDLFKCQGEGGNCGIIGRGAVEPQANNPVTGVFMLVNQACPASCTGSSFSCTTPNASQIRGSVIWNNNTSKYDITFGDISSPDDRRIVKCSEAHTVCIVVCYQNGPCVSEEFGINPATWQGAGQMGLTMDCAYCGSASP